MLINAISSEWEKMKTTRSMWVIGAISIVVSLLGTFLVSKIMPDGELVSDITQPFMFYQPFKSLAIPLLVVLLAMSVTTEYRFNTHIQSLMSTPQRWMFMLSKWVVAVGIVSIFSAIIVGLSLLIVLVTGPPALTDKIDTVVIFQHMGGMFLGILFLGTMVQSIGYITRSTAGTVAISLVWLMGLERFVPFIPRVGNTISKYMFMDNVGFMWNQHSSDPGGLWGTFFILLVWVIVSSTIAYLLLTKRDA